MKQKTKNKFQNIEFDAIFKKAIIILPIGLLGNLIFSYFYHDRVALTYLIQSSYYYFFLAVIISIVPWVTHSLRMFIWAQFLGKKISFFNLLKVAIGSELGAAISPSATGGGPVKAFILKQEGLKTGTAISLTLLGSIEDYTFFILIIPVALVISLSHDLVAFGDIFQRFEIMKMIAYISIAFAIASTILFLLKKRPGVLRKFPKFLKPNRLGAWLTKTRQEISGVYSLIYRFGKRIFLLNIFITALHWFARFSVLMVILSAIGIDYKPIELFLLQWLVFIFTIFIPTPGATGGAEALFYLFFQSTIVESLMGVILPAWRLFTYYIPIGLGILIFLVLNHFQASQIDNTDIHILVIQGIPDS